MSVAKASLEARGLVVRRGDRVVLHGLDLALAAGTTTIVVGPNGAGKSTLIRALAGLAPVDAASGALLLDGAPLDAVPARERARRIGVFLEQPDATFDFSARGSSAWSRFPHLGRALRRPRRRRGGRARAGRPRRAGAGRSPLRAAVLGRRQRIGLARVVAQDPDVWLLDEPTARLDPYHALKVAGLMRARRRRQVVLAAEHDLDLAAQFADRLLILSHGRIVADGAPADVLTPERIAAVYGVRARRVPGERAAVIIDGVVDRVEP
ncbi:MAG: ABC transporter ATP-binding protein [Myxococcota bacterium]